MPQLYKRGDVWHYSFTIDGRRVRRSSGTADKRIASDKAIEHERRERRAAIHGPESVLTFAEAAGLYIEAGKDTRFLLPILDHFKDMKISRITPGMVRDAAMTLYPDASPATMNRQGITPAQAVINFAADKGLCPAIRVRRFPVQRKPRQAGNKHWLEAFQRGARQNGNEDIAALARFMFETGARVGQATALTWEDVDLGARTALLRTRKTGPGGGSWERRAHLTVAMVAELANLPKDRYRVFGYRSKSTVTRAWRRAVATAKIAPLGRHEAGRHGFGTEMIVRGKVDIPTAAEMGGWKSRRLLLETYAHPEGGKEAVDAVFGTPASQGGGKGRRKRRLAAP